MKTIHKTKYNFFRTVIGILLLALTADAALFSHAYAEDDGQVNFNLNDILASAQTGNIYVLNQTVKNFKLQDYDLNSNLLNILKDEKSSNLNRCASAFYLGEIRNPDSTGALADTILLSVDMSKINIVGLPDVLRDMGKYPAMEALIKIGNPSIPAVIQNLANSDDPQVRQLSLQVLTRIDSDKDISQLRLQKALKVETGPQKQARLQTAINSLSEIK